MTTTHTRQMAGTEPGGMRVTRNRLYVADCVEFMARMDAGTVDLTVTSPPLRQPAELQRVLVRLRGHRARPVSGSPSEAAWWCGWSGDKIDAGRRTLSSFRQGLFFQEIGFRMHDVMIYRKKNTPFMRFQRLHQRLRVHVRAQQGGAPKTFNPLTEPDRPERVRDAPPQQGPGRGQQQGAEGAQEGEDPDQHLGVCGGHGGHYQGQGGLPPPGRLPREAGRRPHPVMDGAPRPGVRPDVRVRHHPQDGAAGREGLYSGWTSLPSTWGSPSRG